MFDHRHNARIESVAGKHAYALIALLLAHDCQADLTVQVKIDDDYLRPIGLRKAVPRNARETRCRGRNSGA